MKKTSKRSESQKIGSQGHRWLMAKIEEHPNWIARDQNEDFGIDAEAEFAPLEVKGDILKLQFKSTKSSTVRNGRVRIQVDRKYLEYARACRYPVVLVYADIVKKKCWYLWLQRWLFENGLAREGRIKKAGAIVWQDEASTLDAGLEGDLQDVAQWRGTVQLALSVLDASRAAAAIHKREVLSALTKLLETVSPDLPDVALNRLVEDAIKLGSAMWATLQGNEISQQLYELVRQFGPRIRVETLIAMVKREGDQYSRTGVNALDILYDNHFTYAKTLNLPANFERADLHAVAYFCALREARPSASLFELDDTAGGFEHLGLKFHFRDGDTTTFLSRLANRGPSAVLDYVVAVDWKPT